MLNNMDKKSTKQKKPHFRITNKLLGDWGEWLIEQKLISKGHKIISRKFRKWGGEIDLISILGSKITFIEVKTRFVSPDKSDLYDNLKAIGLNRQKIYRIMKCARFFTDNHTDERGDRLRYKNRGFDAYIVKISPRIDSINDLSAKTSQFMSELDTMEKLIDAFRSRKIQVRVQTIENINLEM
jgi:Holliday junction resolvase-like predicted endonuclease